jgi:hypothetical protein
MATGPELLAREIGRRMLDRAQQLAVEAISARGAGARKAALFLESMSNGLRADALLLLKAFPPAGGGDDDPTPTVAA